MGRHGFQGAIAPSGNRRQRSNPLAEHPENAGDCQSRRIRLLVIPSHRYYAARIGLRLVRHQADPEVGTRPFPIHVRSRSGDHPRQGEVPDFSRSFGAGLYRHFLRDGDGRGLRPPHRPRTLEADHFRDRAGLPVLPADDPRGVVEPVCLRCAEPPDRQSERRRGRSAAPRLGHIGRSRGDLHRLCPVPEFHRCGPKLCRLVGREHSLYPDLHHLLRHACIGRSRHQRLEDLAAHFRAESSKCLALPLPHDIRACGAGYLPGLHGDGARGIRLPALARALESRRRHCPRSLSSGRR